MNQQNSQSNIDIKQTPNQKRTAQKKKEEELPDIFNDDENYAEYLYKKKIEDQEKKKRIAKIFDDYSWQQLNLPGSQYRSSNTDLIYKPKRFPINVIHPEIEDYKSQFIGFNQRSGTIVQRRPHYFVPQQSYQQQNPLIHQGQQSVQYNPYNQFLNDPLEQYTKQQQQQQQYYQQQQQQQQYQQQYQQQQYQLYQQNQGNNDSYYPNHPLQTFQTYVNPDQYNRQETDEKYDKNNSYQMGLGNYEQQQKKTELLQKANLLQMKMQIELDQFRNDLYQT